VLSSQARGEHDCSGKKHGSAVLTDGVLEQGQARVTGSPGARPARREPGRKAEGGDRRLTSPIEWESTWWNVSGAG